jgi:phosphoglycerol transferase
MDAAYFDRAFSHDYERHMYNCFINSPVTTLNVKDRSFTPMDMFPTTLASLGCTISGERLGLGTNLFSDVPTLAEKYTIDEFNVLLGKSSDYYIENFVK